MIDLLTRLATEEGSRELSDECLLAVGWHYEPKHIAHAWQSPDRSWKGFHDRPHPSRSLDDCIRWMVPEGAHWREIVVKALDLMQEFWPRDDWTFDRFVRCCCIASLKAREKTDE